MIDWKRTGGCLLVVGTCLAMDIASVLLMLKVLTALAGLMGGN